MLSEWEDEQAEDETAVLPVPDDLYRPEPQAERHARSWIQAIRDQRAAMNAARQAPERVKQTAQLPAVEVTDPGSSKSPEARLYSGSPEAEERDRQLQGPSAADMAEREQTAIRRLGHQPTENDD